MISRMLFYFSSNSISLAGSLAAFAIIGTVSESTRFAGLVLAQGISAFSAMIVFGPLGLIVLKQASSFEKDNGRFREKDRKQVTSAAIFLPITLLTAFLACKTFGKFTSLEAIYVAAWAACLSVNCVAVNLYNGIHCRKIYFASTFIESLLRVISAALLLAGFLQEVSLIGVYSFISLIGPACFFVFVKRNFDIKSGAITVFTLGQWGKYLVNAGMKWMCDAGAVYIWTFVAALQQFTDRAILSQTHGDLELATYGLVTAIGYAGASQIAAAMMQSTSPDIFRKQRMGFDAASKLAFRSSFWLLILSGVFVTLSGLLIREADVATIVNEKLGWDLRSPEMLVAMFSSGVIFGAAQIQSNAMMMRGQMTSLSAIKMLTSIAGIGFNFALIPRMGAAGAIVSSLIFSCIYAFTIYSISYRKIRSISS